MAILNEIEDGLAIKLDIFKRITGQDTMSISPYNKEFEFQNKAKLFIISNSLPNFGNSTDAAWRRVKILPFKEHFDIEKRDIFLQEELAEETEGIFNWMLEGYQMWITDKQLKEPECIHEIAREYQILADPLGGYFYKCSLGEEYTCRVQELYYHYKTFCEANELKPVSQNKFGMILSAKGIERYRDNYGIRCYRGIKHNYMACMEQ